MPCAASRPASKPGRPRDLVTYYRIWGLPNRIQAVANDLKELVHAECMRVLDAFMAALNAYDARAMDRAMHFPHVRIAGGTVTVYEQPGRNPMDLFEKLKKQDDWKWSRWE